MNPRISSPVRQPRLSGRPFVRLNLAITADGKIATANRAISSFGSRRDLLHLYQLRNGTDAILCGATTVNSENADLGPGPDNPHASENKWPLRVIVSGRGRVDLAARLFRRPFGPIVVLTTERIAPARLRQLQSVAQHVHVCGVNQVDFTSAFGWLRSQWNVRHLLCEGGGQVNAALFEADLVDEIHLTVCPWIVGGRQAPTLADGRGVADLAQASTWQLHRTRRFSNELFLIYRRSPQALRRSR
jgi:riboflavin-specific deaminase-like protein